MTAGPGTQPAGGPPAGGPPAGGPPPVTPAPSPELDVASLHRLDGRTAIVVGGYGGIGRVVTRLLAHHGAAVAIAGRSLEKAEGLAAELDSDGARAAGLTVDVASRASAEELVAGARDRLGGVDILVNLAAIDIEASAQEMSEEDWERSLQVNLSGAFWLSQAAGRAMIDAGKGGRIVHFSSTRAYAGGRRGFAAYSASKGGLNALVRQLATEWGRHAITVNAVAPGFVPTELTAHAVQNEGFVRMMIGRIPMTRFGTPEEMAAAVHFLASPGGGFVNGQCIYVDGGVTASS